MSDFYDLHKKNRPIQYIAAWRDITTYSIVKENRIGNSKMQFKGISESAR